MKTVVVIDSKRSRGQAMAAPFRSIEKCSCVLHTQDSKSSRWVTESAGIQSDPCGVESPFLVLRHFGDQHYLSNVGHLGRTIFYGGNGGDDPRAPVTMLFVVQRAINGKVDAITASEAEELMAFFEHTLEVNRGVLLEASQWPTILRPAKYSENLTALLFLCHGFLAHYAWRNAVNRGVDTKHFAFVGKALRGMGWVEDEAAETVSQTVDDLDLDEGQPMPGIAFWSAPFEGTKSLRDGVQSELPKSASGLPDSIEDLVKAIEGNNVSDEQFIDIVAKAYLELNSLLEAA
jgi:hypothetical protein